ncbi:MAG: hypothetical protein R6U86_11240 [Bacteroidales bacterium]
MKNPYSDIANNNTSRKVALNTVTYDNERYFRISNHDKMRPFFMSIVSDANHWMFISSNGGLSAGRKNPEYALFPYYTDDKITESADMTGSKTIVRVHAAAGVMIWEPFSERQTGKYAISRNLYKSVYGNKILFEEVNHDLDLAFRYQWSPSRTFGFVRRAELVNNSDKEVRINLLDGIQNIMSYGVPSDLQKTTSNLVDAYKRSELEPTSGIGIYALSAIIVDKAEPSEALKANIAWSAGLEHPIHLLSSLQLNRFRQVQRASGEPELRDEPDIRGERNIRVEQELRNEQGIRGERNSFGDPELWDVPDIVAECDIKGEKGAYFVSAPILLPGRSGKKWMIIANVNQDHAQIIRLSKAIREDDQLLEKIGQDIDAGTQNLVRLVAAADGLQYTADKLNDARHFANTMFNIMRGGVFDNNYQVKKSDFVPYLSRANKEVVARNRDLIRDLEDTFSQGTLKDRLSKCDDVDLARLSMEYLPLKFSRRHGDPSRPWNYFTINIENESDGSEILDYEGNWRDLFQNWEALAQAYPEFIEGMIFKFLNASTFDGYNPYRVTKGGFDWETIETDNPWSYIGYWGDHQIIYLQKFFEIAEKYHPGILASYFDKEWFVYAAVPYIIKPYDALLKNPKDTIGFDHQWDAAIRKRREVLGADGALLTVDDGDAAVRTPPAAEGAMPGAMGALLTGDAALPGPAGAPPAADGKRIYHVNFLEKILATVLAKLSNFIPGAGIWLNTQRPEWNDANNALVGNGVSMVTLYYLRRFMHFFQGVLERAYSESTNPEGAGPEIPGPGIPDQGNIKISGELAAFFHSIKEALSAFRPLLAKSIDDLDRKRILDRLGKAASDYRQNIYQNGFSGKKEMVSVAGLKEFTAVCLEFIDHSIRANRRDDKLFHAYNLMTVTENGVSCDHLSEMLEGQVAVLSSGFLSSEEVLEVLDALKRSALFRADQYSYILYPNKDLPGFLQKNTISAQDAGSSALIRTLIADGNTEIVVQDVLGGVHFNGNFKNARDLEGALDALAANSGQQGAQDNREQSGQQGGQYKGLVEKDRKLLQEIFEKVFNHKAFTGRSGTFFAYEGLGSIYWHMVSKLLLAVQECCLKAIDEKANPVTVGKLLEHYYEIEAGIGTHKPPELYGAFPTDPYSHTPQHRGAQQPGMTGQVKEDVLSRFGELGVAVNGGQLYFNPSLLRKEEFLSDAQTFEYVAVNGLPAKLPLNKGQLAFTCCAVPVVYAASDNDQITVCYANGSREGIAGNALTPELSSLVFKRTGKIERLEVSLKGIH